MDIISLTQRVGNLSGNGLREKKNDDLWTDRLCYRWSVLILAIFAVLITSKAYVGDPIDCWSPPEFKSSYERYAETLCFVNGTYHISVDEPDIPIEPEKRYMNRVRYYQWTPFILLLQAFFMYIPRLFWVAFNKRNGINLYSLVDAAHKYESLDSFADKEKIMVYLCKNLLRSIQLNEFKHKKDYISNEFYKNNRTELSKLLCMKPELRAESSKEYNSNLHRVIATNRNPANKNKKVIIINSEDLKERAPEFQPPVESRLSKKRASISHSKKMGNKTTTDSDNTTTPTCSTTATFESDNNNINQPASSDVLHMESSLSRYDIILKKINSISKKHIFNILSADYTVNLKSLSELKTAPGVISTVNSRRQSSLLTCCMPDLSKNFLPIVYLISKCIYLISLFAQFFFLNRLIGNGEFYMLGVNLIRSFLTDDSWPRLSVFPRVTLCEIFIREIGTVHPYVIQCVLRINIFNEVIFVVIWFWLVFLICVLTIDALYHLVCILYSCTSCKRKEFALKYLDFIRINSVVHDEAKNILNQEIFNDIRLILNNNKNENVIAEETFIQVSSNKAGYNKRSNKYYQNNVNSNYNNKNNSNNMKGNDDNIYYDNNFESSHVLVDSDKVPENYYSRNFGNSANKQITVVNANDGDDDDTCHYGVDTSFDIDIDGIYKNIPLTVNNNNSNSKPQRCTDREADFKEICFLLKISREEELAIFERFCENCFSNDTMFALRIIQQNSTNIIISEIVEYLWLQYKSLNFIVSAGNEEFILKKLVVYRNEPVSDPHITFESKKKQLSRAKRTESVIINRADFSASPTSGTDAEFSSKYIKKIKRKK